MKPKKALTLTIIITAIVVIVVLLAYILNFRDLTISKDTQTWGTFGDYFGGILNPILGIINVIILIYITFQIASNEATRSENEIAIQKQIALNSLRHDALKELNRILEQVQPELVRSEDDSPLKIILIRNEFNAYIDTYSYLFPFFENTSHASLENSILEISTLSEHYSKNRLNINIDTEIKPILENFQNLKSALVNDIQRSILE